MVPKISEYLKMKELITNIIFGCIFLINLMDGNEV